MTVAWTALLLLAGSPPAVFGGVITQIIDSTGDGTHPLDSAAAVAVDRSGNAFVGGLNTIFKITPQGAITQIIDASGAGPGQPFSSPYDLAVDAAGNLYATTGDAVFKITPSGVKSRILDETGDGLGNTLHLARGLALDSSSNAYVGAGANNPSDDEKLFKITPSGEITVLMDASGDGAGNPLGSPFGVAVDGDDNVYVVGGSTTNVFKVTPSGTITEIADFTGDGNGNTLNAPKDIVATSAGDVYVTSTLQDGVFRITPNGIVSKIQDPEDLLHDCMGIAADAASTIYVRCGQAQNTAVYRISAAGEISQLLDHTGDGTHSFTGSGSFSIAASDDGTVFVTANESRNAFRISPGAPIALFPSPPNALALALLLLASALLCIRTPAG